MLKKVLYTLIGLSITFTSAKAQDFTFFNGTTMYDTTQGFPLPFDPTSINYIEMDNYISNNSGQDITCEWRNLSTDTTQNPEGWVLVGVCDNINCRGAYGPWYFGSSETTNPIEDRGTGLLSIHVYVPETTPDNTTGIYKIEVKTASQTDTAVFVITKDGNTGISALRLDDNRVSLYPNPLPAGQDLNIYVDKSLNATEAVVYSIIGQKQMVLPLNKSNEVHSLNTGKLPAGMYFVKVTDKSGNVIASRKFAKQ